MRAKPLKTPFSREFRDWSDNQIELLPGYGWTDGGCLIMAHALEIWSQGQLHPRVFVFKDEEEGVIASHYCVGLTSAEGCELLIDGDGVWRDYSLESSLNANANNRCYLLDPLLGYSLYMTAINGDRPDFEVNLPGFESIAYLLVHRLNEEFGPFDVERIRYGWDEVPSKRCSFRS